MNLSQLSKHDAITLLEIAYDSLSCLDLDHFQKIVLNLQSLTPFEHVFCTTLNQQHKIPLRVVELNYPKKFLSRYFEKEYYLNDHVIDELLATSEIQHWGTVDKKYRSLEKREASTMEAIEFGLKDGLTYGTLDEDQIIGSSFSFAGKFIENNNRAKTIITYAVTHLSEALKKIQYQEQQKHHKPLTRREKEILCWVKDGKTSFEISIILGISERTTNFHINNAKRKLNASTRSHAVVKAIAMGEIAF